MPLAWRGRVSLVSNHVILLSCQMWKSGGKAWNFFGVPEIYRKPDGAIANQATTGAPLCFWQVRQWQNPLSVTVPRTSKRTAPQRQPPADA